MSGCVRYKGLILTHIPIIESEVMGHFYRNIHGHTHTNKMKSERYVNVCCEVLDYTPKTLVELGIVIPNKVILNQQKKKDE